MRHESARLAAISLFAIGSASAFGWALDLFQIPRAPVGGVEALGLGPVAFGLVTAPRKRLKHFSPCRDIVLKHGGRILATSPRGDPPPAPVRPGPRVGPPCSEEGTGP